MSDLWHLAKLEPEETRRILREEMRLRDYGAAATARAMHVSEQTLNMVIRLLKLSVEFREARRAVRSRFADPERR